MKQPHYIHTKRKMFTLQQQHYTHKAKDGVLTGITTLHIHKDVDDVYTETATLHIHKAKDGVCI